MPIYLHLLSTTSIGMVPLLHSNYWTNTNTFFLTKTVFYSDFCFYLMSSFCSKSSLKMPYLLPYRVLCLVAQLYLTLCNPQGSPHIMLFFLENFLEFTQRVGLRKPTRLLPVDGLSPLSKEIPRTETVCCSGSDSTFEFLGSCRFPGFLAIHKKIRFKP